MRFWILVLCGWLAGSSAALAGTNNKGTKGIKGTVRLVLWHAYRAKEKRALEQVVQKYNLSQKKVQVQTLAIPYDAYADKITAACPQGHGPNMFIFAHDRIGDWAEAKIIEPITFWVNEKLLGRFFPKTVQVLAYKNALYGLPLAFKTLALFYNKKLIKRPPPTTKELLKVAKKLTNRAKGHFGLAYQIGDFYYHAPWLHGFGGQIFTGNKLTLNTPASARALAFARDLRWVHKLLPSEPTSYLVSTLFNQGKAAMVINGPWFRGEIKGNIQYGVAPLPRVSSTGKFAAPFLTSEAIMINRKSKHKRLAFEFIKYLTSKKAAMVRLSVGQQPVANKACFQSAKARKDPVMMAFRQQLQQSIPMANTPAMRMVWTPMLNALGKVLRKQATPKTALKEAQREVLAYIKGKKK